MAVLIKGIHKWLDRYIIISRYAVYKMPSFHLLDETTSLFLVHDGMQILADTSNSNDPEFSGFQGGEGVVD